MKFYKIFSIISLFFLLISFFIFFNSFSNKVGTNYEHLCADYMKYNYSTLKDNYEKIPKDVITYFESCTTCIIKYPNIFYDWFNSGLKFSYASECGFVSWSFPYLFWIGLILLILAAILRLRN